MNAVEALYHEIVECEEGARPIAHLRVSLDAIPDSPTWTPITPERARTIALKATEDGVIADPSGWLHAVEIVIHPQDFLEVQREADRIAFAFGGNSGVPTSFMGLPIKR